jgi:hypothetical protein
MLSYFVSYLVSPLLRSHSTDIAAERSSRSTSTNSGLPPIVVICIVATGGTSASPTVFLWKNPVISSYYFPPFFPPGPAPLRGKPTIVFVVALGLTSLYLYIRRSRERTKRNEHREKAWQFKDMKRDGLRPTLKTEGGLPSSGSTPVQISDPVLMTEATSSPRYPTRAFRW